MLAEETPAQDRRVEERPVRTRQKGLVDHREVVGEGVEAEMLRPGRKHVQAEHGPGHRRKESGVLEDRVHAAGPLARERSPVPARECEYGKRSVQDPGQLSKAFEMKGPDMGEIERHERKEGGADERQQERPPAERAQHDGMMRTMLWTRGERPGCARE